MLTGESAFPAETVTAAVEQILGTLLREPVKSRTDIPGDLNRLIMQMLLKVPEQRPSAAHLLQALKKINTAHETEVNENRIRDIWEDLDAGKSFWEGLWPLFISREVDRYLVKEVLKKAYVMSSGNFKTMLNVINVNQKDYRKFMSLMYK